MTDIDLKLHQLASVTQMNEEALVDEFGIERLYVQFWPGYFSPDGKLFAFAVGDPDPEQAWVYDMSSRRLMPVTEVPARGWLMIRGMSWVSDTFYAETNYGGSRDHYFAATAVGARQISELPAAAQEALKHERRQKTDMARNDRFVVTFGRPCSGCSFSLSVTTPPRRQDLSNCHSRT